MKFLKFFFNYLRKNDFAKHKNLENVLEYFKILIYLMDTEELEFFIDEIDFDFFLSILLNNIFDINPKICEISITSIINLLHHENEEV